MRASMLSSFKQFLTGESVLPPVLKAASEATVEIGTANMSLVNVARAGYLGALTFHHARMSKDSSKLAPCSGSDRYCSRSVLTVSVLFNPMIISFNSALVSLVDPLELEATDLSQLNYYD